MCDSNYTDHGSRSEPAYVDPSLRRRMSCFLTPIACIDLNGCINPAAACPSAVFWKEPRFLLAGWSF